MAGATQRQTESYLKPLLRKLKNKVNNELEELSFFNNYCGFSKSSTIRVPLNYQSDNFKFKNDIGFFYVEISAIKKKRC